jgi:hypothetical protein
MRKYVYPLIVLGFFSSAASAQQAELDAARTALLAPAGYTGTIVCAGRLLPPFAAHMREQDGKIIAKFANCERELRLKAADHIEGETCSGTTFRWVHKPADAKKPFIGYAGACTVELVPK